MQLDLIINNRPEGIEIAVLKDGVLTELHKDQVKTGYAVGDIYLGKVRKVIPSLNASFVDVGYERDAFLHYLDLGAQFSSMKEYTKRVQSGRQESADLSEFKILQDIDKSGKIKDQVSGSQQVIVQVAKEPISSKGPRLTAEITLPGRFLVLVPFSKKVSISQRIKDEAERDRLRRLMKSITPPNCGVIVRTVAENQKVAELDQDLRDLVDRWHALFRSLKKAKPPKRVLGELDKISTILRDVMTPDFTGIQVNDEGLASEIRNYLKSIAPEKEGILKVHRSDDLFDKYKIHKQIKSAFGKQVNLKSGAYLIVEHTEAMHVIDVNSGNRKGGAKTQEENALQTNLECAEEIARILRLRDMGGIICVDFIDMHERANQKKLHDVLRNAMKDDKAKHNVLAPSRFGVVEITRQRVRPVTDIKTAEKCPSCNGEGVVQAPILFTDELESNIKFLSEEGHKRLKMSVHPMIEAYITKGNIFNPSRLKKWSKKYGVSMDVQSSASLQFLEQHFYDVAGDEIKM